MQDKTHSSDLLKELNILFREILDNDNITLTENTTASDIEEWDSLNHIALMVAIEKKFNLHFTAKEIQDFKNVGEICESIMSKQNLASKY